MKEHTLPQIVWMYWEQGLDNAPEVVKQCHTSWCKLNPDWEVRMLDGNSVLRYVDLPAVIGRNYDGLPIQHRSDILRLGLLAKFGGVWADATCLCNRPLDSWIHEYMGSGFFMFRDPGRDRVISSWFIASLPGNHLTASFYEAHMNFWRTNRFLNSKNKFRKHLVRMVRALLGKRMERQDYWLSLPVRRVLRIYPYFIFHYHFAYHVRHDGLSREIFEKMPYYAAGPAQALRKRMLRGIAQSVALLGDKETAVPVSKLTWKKTLPRLDLDATEI